MLVSTYLLALLFLIVIAINYWVWFNPKSFMNFMIIAKKSPFEQSRGQRAKWEIIEDPKFIWFPRFIILLVLLVLIFVVIQLIID